MLHVEGRSFTTIVDTYANNTILHIIHFPVLPLMSVSFTVTVDDIGLSGIGGIAREPDIKSILGLLQKEKTASIEAAAAKPVSSYNNATSLSTSSTLGSTSINFNNAAVQQALDNLINSGPNLLKSLKDVGKTPPGGAAPAASRPYADDEMADPYEDFERSYAAGQQYRGGAYWVKASANV